MKKLQELKTSLIIALACIVLVMTAYVVLPSYANAVPGFLQGLCTVFNFALPLALLYVIWNDGVDAWPIWLAFLLATAVLSIQLGYKCTSKVDPASWRAATYLYTLKNWIVS